jgi:hypothetical protein
VAWREWGVGEGVGVGVRKETADATGRLAETQENRERNGKIAIAPILILKPPELKGLLFHFNNNYLGAFINENTAGESI